MGVTLAAVHCGECSLCSLINTLLATPGFQCMILLDHIVVHLFLRGGLSNEIGCVFVKEWIRGFI